MTKRIRIRPIRNKDLPFLYEVYATTRDDIVSAVGLTEMQRCELLRHQFEAQHRDYQIRFPIAEFGIVELAKKPIGRLYLNRTQSELHLIEISILPSHRSRGIGSRLIQDIKQEACKSNRRVRIHVETGSRAVSFYEKHGFEIIGEKPFHLEMVWSRDISGKTKSPKQAC